MTVVSDYQLNPNWGWFDFSMVTAVMLVFAFVDLVLFIWWIRRNSVKIRVAGVFKFFLDKRVVPLSIFSGFSKTVSDPMMQDALKVLDHYPDNLTQGDENMIAAYKDYLAVLYSYSPDENAPNGRWPPNLPYSFAIYIQYRTHGATSGKNFMEWMRDEYMYGRDRQAYGVMNATSDIAQVPNPYSNASMTTPLVSPTGANTSRTTTTTTASATQFRQFPASATNAPFDPFAALHAQ